MNVILILFTWSVFANLETLEDTPFTHVLIGETSKNSLHSGICDISRFGNRTSWITQARTNLERPASCPIVGTYKGELPDSPGYCAQLFSDCSRTDLMYYAVDECNNPNSIYERTPFPQPLEVTPGVYIPPERFDSRYTTKASVNFPDRRDQSFINVPREIQVGAINLLPAKSRTNLQNSVYDTASVQGAALIITKKKKREAQNGYDALYNIRHPKTTTMSFAWGRENSFTTTKPSLNMRENQHQNYWGNQPSPEFLQNTNPQRNLEPMRPNPWSPNDFRPPETRGSPFRSSFVSATEQTNQQHLQQDYRPFNRNFDYDYISRGVMTDSNLGSPIASHGSLSHNNGNNRPLSVYPEMRENQVRSLPIGSNNNDHDPLGFWPNAEERPDPKPDNQIPSSVIRNEPMLIERPIPLQEDLWRGPPSPSPSMRDISRSSTPLPFIHDIKNDNIDTNNIIHKRKRDPVIEEREYQCIGEWEENGVLYALTLRKDIHTYECFVGMATAQGIAYIKEAGKFCSRNVNPNEFGMKTVIQEECIEETGRSRVSDSFSEKQEGFRGSRWITSRARETSPTRPPWVPTTTRPWKPITGRPRRRNNSNLVRPTYQLIPIVILILYCINSFL